jgi:hypothetical protein
MSRVLVGLILPSRFLGVVGEGGHIDVQAKLKWSSTVAYEWSVISSSVDEKQRVEVRCDNAIHQPIPLPDGWATGLRNAHLHDAARAACSLLQANEVFANIDCRAIGACKMANVGSGPHDAGRVVRLQAPDGSRQDYLLCAHVRGDEWICHKGSVDRHRVLDDDDPFKASCCIV